MTIFYLLIIDKFDSYSWAFVFKFLSQYICSNSKNKIENREKQSLLNSVFDMIHAKSIVLNRFEKNSIYLKIVSLDSLEQLRHFFKVVKEVDNSQLLEDLRDDLTKYIHQSTLLEHCD